MSSDGEERRCRVRVAGLRRCAREDLTSRPCLGAAPDDMARLITFRRRGRGMKDSTTINDRVFLGSQLERHADLP